MVNSDVYRVTDFRMCWSGNSSCVRVLKNKAISRVIKIYELLIIEVMGVVVCRIGIQCQVRFHTKWLVFYRDRYRKGVYW